MTPNNANRAQIGSIILALEFETMRLLQPINYIVITLSFNVVTSFTIVTSSARNTCSSELRQGTSYKANLKGPDHDSKLCSHGIPLRMSKQEDMFSDQEEGTEADIDTSDFEFVNMKDGEFSDEFITEMQDSAPDQLTIMKDVSRHVCTFFSL